MLDERVRGTSEQLSVLAGWWPARRGSELAEELRLTMYQMRYWDVNAIKGLRANRDFRPARDLALTAWAEAQSLANQLRAEIRSEAPPVQHKLLLPVHPSHGSAPRAPDLRGGRP